MIDSLFILFVCVCVFFVLFRASPVAYGGSQAMGSNQSCSHWPTPEPQQCQIQAASVNYTTAHGNAGFLTHWAKPGIEPATSWLPARFVNHWTMIDNNNFILIELFVNINQAFFPLSPPYLHVLIAVSFISQNLTHTYIIRLDTYIDKGRVQIG